MSAPDSTFPADLKTGDHEAITDPDTPTPIKAAHRSVEEWWAEAHGPAHEVTLLQEGLARQIRALESHRPDADPCVICTTIVDTLRRALPFVPLTPETREYIDVALDVTMREVDLLLNARKTLPSK